MNPKNLASGTRLQAQPLALNCGRLLLGTLPLRRRSSQLRGLRFQVQTLRLLPRALRGGGSNTAQLISLLSFFSRLLLKAHPL